MLTLRLVEKVLGILTLMLWGSFAYIGIPETVEKLPSYQVPLVIIAICLPLFIPVVLLLSEGFWARHVILTTILGWIGGLLAALAWLVLIVCLPGLGIGLSQYSDSLASDIMMWLLGGLFLLFADAVVIFKRVSRKRLPRKYQQFVGERDDYLYRLYRPQLHLEKRMVHPKMTRVGTLIPKTWGLLWEVGLQNVGEVPIFARHHWVEFKGVETSASITLPHFCYKVLDEAEGIAGFPLEIAREKGEVVLKVFVDNPTAEERIEKILGQQRTLKMSVKIGYQIAGVKQYDLEATEVSEVFSFPRKPRLGDQTTDLVDE